MKIAVFTDEHRQQIFLDSIESLNVFGKKTACVLYQNYDDFISEVAGVGCKIMIIARDGADGMESARAAKILLPTVPLIWFSDDNGFGPESYRVGCSYFSASPLTEELIKNAVIRCKDDCAV